MKDNEVSIIFKDKKDPKEGKYYMGEGNRKQEFSGSILDDKILLIERIKKLEQEVLELRQEIETIKRQNQEGASLSNDHFNKDFKPILNYNLFKEKNSEIIDLYSRGRKKEEIARALNKSVREVEMVINLIKK